MTPESRVAFITYMTSNNFPPYLVERTSHWFGMDLAEIGDQIERLRALGFEVSGPRKRGGVTSTERSAYLNAQDDVPRIRTIFHRHWGKRNRHHLPLAEEIAALRWKLTHAETEKLIRSFRRQGAQES